MLLSFSFCEISFCGYEQVSSSILCTLFLSFFPVSLSSLSLSLLFSSLLSCCCCTFRALQIPFPHCPQFLFCPRVLSVFQQTGYDDEEEGGAAGGGGGGGGRGACRLSSVQ